MQCNLKYFLEVRLYAVTCSYNFGFSAQDENFGRDRKRRQSGGPISVESAFVSVVFSSDKNPVYETLSSCSQATFVFVGDHSGASILYIQEECFIAHMQVATSLRKI